MAALDKKYSKNTRGADLKGGVQKRPADATKNHIHIILKIQLCSELTLRIMDVNYSSGAETQAAFTVTSVKRIKLGFFWPTNVLEVSF